MGNIDEAIKRTDSLFKRIIEIAKEKSGDDYDKYVSVYMTLPGANGVTISKNENGEEVLIRYEGYNSIPTDLWIREGGFSLNGYFDVGEDMEWISLSSNNPEKAKDYYNALNKLLDNLDSIELTYDKEKTTAIDNPIVKKHLLKELIKRCCDMHLSDVGEYPTIQATADYYALILADYFVSEGKSIIDNQEVEKRINSFRDYLVQMLAVNITRDTLGVYIDCEVLLRDYNFARKYGDFARFNKCYLNSPLPASLRHIGVSLGSFLGYYEENWCKGKNRYTIATTTTLATASPISDKEKLVPIPSDIREKLEKLSYKIITYVRENNLFTDTKDIKLLMLIMMRFWHWLTPIIKDASSNGYSIPDDDEICRIVANSNDNYWGFVNLLNIIRNYDSGKATDDSGSIRY